MIAYLLYAPLALAAAVLLFYTARGAVLGYGNGRLAPLAVLLAAAFSGSLYLVFGVDEPWGRWAAVGVAGAAVGPILLPVAGMIVSVVYAKVSGEPMRWN